jgi:serpin B
VIHHVVAEINEEGTQAAAATVVESDGAGLRQYTFEMIVNRPFFFAVCDDYTGTILFMASVESLASKVSRSNSLWKYFSKGRVPDS